MERHRTRFAREGLEAALTDKPRSGAPAKLDGKQQAAIVHRYVSDLAYAEIAVILECSEAAARQNVRAGLTSLRNHLVKEPQP